MLYVTYILLFASLYFEVFLLVSFLQGSFKKASASKRTSKSLPSVAIVVPCFNEESGLAATLTSLLALDYPKSKLHVVVVDDGSTDNTLAIARGFTTDPRVVVLSKPNGGKHTAMNMALAHTRAQLIGCLDADSVVEASALRHVVNVFDNERVAAVTPGIHVKETSNALQHMQKVEYQISVFNRFILAALGSTFITPGPFSIFRTSVIRELGGWKYAHSTEDMEMALRMQVAGYLIANAPGATVHTATPVTFMALYKQRVRWTYGFLRNAFDYRHMIGSRKFGNLGLVVLPSSFAAVGIGMYLFIRLVWQTVASGLFEYTKFSATETIPHMNLSLFYINTSAMLFLVWISAVLILVLASTGSWIGTGSRKLPMGTPLFFFFYCFFVPMWLFAAVYRAAFKTGVRWR